MVRRSGSAPSNSTIRLRALRNSIWLSILCWLRAHGTAKTVCMPRCTRSINSGRHPDTAAKYDDFEWSALRNLEARMWRA